MGLDVNGARFLLYCRALGVDFTQAAMIGRQNLNLSRSDLKRVFKSFGTQVDERQISSIFKDGYAENFLRHLGAKEVHSFDISGFEGATHLHDMNLELPERFDEEYTIVLDSGSLEHVFNFPVAIKNCMRMVAVGGHYLAITPANNFLGHGFYQFSPEVFFSLFDNQNGFVLRRLIAFEDFPNARWYCVKRPVGTREQDRMTLTNTFRVYLHAIAKKVSRGPILETSPQQHLYLQTWNSGTTCPEGDPGTAPQAAAKHSTFLESIKRLIPVPVKLFLWRIVRCFHSRFSPRFFSPMDPTVPSGSHDQ